jgi:phage N-6-adenine-methyltransferase
MNPHPTPFISAGIPRRFTTVPGTTAGRAVSSAKRRAARQNGRKRRKGQWPLVKGRQDWATPPALFAALDAEFHFTLDVAASAENAKCPRFYDEQTDGLTRPWAPERCWVNPPYHPAVLPRFVEKGYVESQRGALVVLLVPARTDTTWWHRYVALAAEVRFLPGRVRFILPSGRSSSSPFPSAIVVFRPAAL